MKKIYLKDVLEAQGFEAFTQALKETHTPDAAVLSLKIGAALCRASLGLVGHGRSHWLDKIDAHISEKAPLMPLAHDLMQFKYVGCESVTSIAIEALGDLLTPCDWDDLTDVEEGDIAALAFGAAHRVYECLLEAYSRQQPSYVIAKEIADAAIKGEEQWQTGTNTHFMLVEEPVMDLLDKHLNEIQRSDAFKTELEALCQKACAQVLEQVLF